MFTNVLNKTYLVLATIALLGCDQGKDEYYRADCIVRINIDWSGYNADRRRQIHEDILFETASAYHKTLGYESPFPGPGGSLRGEDNEFAYLQFKGMCEKRYEFAENIIAYFKDNFDDVPPMEVDPGTFEPGRDTIESYGSWWIDGERAYQPQ